MAPDLTAQDVVPVEVDLRRAPAPTVRIVLSDATVVNVALELERKDARLVLQEALLNGNAGGRLLRRIGVVFQ